MNVSMDLRIERAPGEQGGGEWLRIGDELHREFNARAQRLALMVHGRTMFEIMEPFWPKAASDESQPETMREYGRIWTDKPKVLVSSSRRTAGFNTRVVGGDGDAIDALARLRAETDGDIGVGGATVATQLLRRGLLDQLLLFVHPVILGGGRPLFDVDADRDPVECDLVESASFPDGVVMHRYTIRNTTQ
jgi:dihydrofolate reductase